MMGAMSFEQRSLYRRLTEIHIFFPNDLACLNFAFIQLEAAIVKNINACYVCQYHYTFCQKLMLKYNYDVKLLCSDSDGTLFLKT